MSLKHYIIPKQSYDLESFFQLISKIDDIRHEYRGNQIHYLWAEGRSTRGMDFSVEGDRIEIRNTVFSNEGDYFVTNILVKLFREIYKCKVVDGGNRKVKSDLVISNEQATNQIYEDYSTIKAMHEIDGGTIGLQGPYRTPELGKKVFSNLLNLNDSDAIRQLEKLIRSINYDYNDFQSGNILEYYDDETPDDRKIMKLLTNEQNFFLSKYDYLIINENDNPIVFTNENLNTILPIQWTLLDDYNITAPILPEKDWKEFIERARKFNIHDEVFGG